MEWLKKYFRRNRIPNFGKGKIVWVEGNRFVISWHDFHDGQLNIMLEKTE